MTWLARLRSWSKALTHRADMESAMDAEMRFHIQARTDDLMREGLSPEQALRRARMEFGTLDSQKNDCRQSLGLRFWDELRADLRYTFRSIRKNLAVSLLTILCLTVGIGSNAAVFSWIEGILLRPFPAVAHQERMMAITGTNRGVAGAVGNIIPLSWPDLQDLAKNCKLFDAFIVDRITGSTLSIGDHAQWAVGSIVSSNYLKALGVRPILGRGFEPEEDVGRNAHPVTVISYQLWKDRFHGDPAIIGKTQIMNGMPHTIIGVTQEGFNGTFIGWAMQFWVPVSMQERFDPPGYKLEDRGARWIEGYAIRKPGVTPAQAQQEISAVTKRLEEAYPATNRNRGMKLFPLWQTPFNNAGTLLPTLSIALAVVFSVLLITCANVSNLLLVRAFARRHEMTVRLAVGARRGRLMKQLLTESLIFSILGGVCGLVFANWCRNLLVLLLPARSGIRMNLPGEIDWRVLLLSTGVCVLCTILFGLVPAIQTSNVDLTGTLKTEAGGVLGGRRKGLVRSGLVLVQVALSFVLLVGAVLLLQSLRSMQNTDPGFSTDRVLVSAIDFRGAGYDVQRIKNFQDQLIDRVQALPGVESAAFATVVPFGYRGYNSVPIAVDGSQAPPEELPAISYNQVGPEYLATMGIPLISGREFTRADNETAPLVAIVNQAMAAQFWPGQDPIGRRMQVKGQWMQVIGVAKNSKYRSITETPAPFFYVPLRQNPSGSNLQVRSSLAPRTLAQSLGREIHALDENLAPLDVITMREQVERTMAPQRVTVLMLGSFGILALALAGVGLYGVMSYTVSQSTRELGLRMALGAVPSDLLRLVMSRGLKLAAGGLIAGAAVAFGTSRLLGYLLYHVSPRDPLAFGSALIVMVLASLAACIVPAWRAARIDPVQSLRS